MINQVFAYYANVPIGYVAPSGSKCPQSGIWKFRSKLIVCTLDAELPKYQGGSALWEIISYVS